MRALKTIGKYFWRFMIIFSFIVNIILVVVLLVLGLTIFDIKKNIAQPLLQGLHSSFVGLNNSTIDWTIPVDETIHVERATAQLDTSIPINVTETIVTLTQPVPLNVSANINLPGIGNLSNAQVALTLPQGTQLPVSLSFGLPVQQDVTVSLDVPVDLNVRAIIPINQTQLADPINNLELLFDPIVRVLGNLPGDFGQVGPFVGQVLSANRPNLLAETDYIRDPWPGYSITAGLNYPPELANAPIPPENIPELTGIVPQGGIPLLDEGVRPEAYQGDSDPATVNAQAGGNMQSQSIPAYYYDGTYAQYVVSPRKVAESWPEGAPTDGTGGPQQPSSGENTDSGQTGDLGIVATPQPGG
jgi:hypothetical protein